jgi:hypothetical protein
VNDRVPRRLARGEGERVLLFDGAGDVDEAEDEQEQDRQDESEFDERLTAVIAATPERSHH